MRSISDRLREAVMDDGGLLAEAADEIDRLTQLIETKPPQPGGFPT